MYGSAAKRRASVPYSVDGTIQRVKHVTLGLAHLFAFFIADQSVQVDVSEGNFTRILDAHHDHAGNPEEEDVIAGFHDGGRIKIVQVLGIIRPAQGGMRPETGTEPGIQHIRGPVRCCCEPHWDRSAGSSTADDHLAAILAVPDRDAVSPPQLAADAPVTDVFHPVQVDLGETFGDDVMRAVC